MNKTIALYGNIVADTILEIKNQDWEEDISIICHDSYQRLGGMFNVFRGIKILSSLNVIMDRTEKDVKSSATIICNTKRNTRTSFVTWKDQDYIPNIQVADWHHIGYLDTLPNLRAKHLQEMQGIISADLCCSNHTDFERARLKNLISHVDYLFMSDSEADSLFLKSGKPVPLAKKATIVHARNLCFIIDTNEYIHFEPITPRRSVLGAGDFFAAAFICDQIENESSIKSSVVNAFNATRMSLL